MTSQVDRAAGMVAAAPSPPKPALYQQVRVSVIKPVLPPPPPDTVQISVPRHVAETLAVILAHVAGKEDGIRGEAAALHDALHYAGIRTNARPDYEGDWHYRGARITGGIRFHD